MNHLFQLPFSVLELSLDSFLSDTITEKDVNKIVSLINGFLNGEKIQVGAHLIDKLLHNPLFYPFLSSWASQLLEKSKKSDICLIPCVNVCALAANLPDQKKAVLSAVVPKLFSNLLSCNPPKFIELKKLMDAYPGYTKTQLEKIIASGKSHCTPDAIYCISSFETFQLFSNELSGLIGLLISNLDDLPVQDLKMFTPSQSLPQIAKDALKCFDCLNTIFSTNVTINPTTFLDACHRLHSVHESMAQETKLEPLKYILPALRSASIKSFSILLQHAKVEKLGELVLPLLLKQARQAKTKSDKLHFYSSIHHLNLSDNELYKQVISLILKDLDQLNKKELFNFEQDKELLEKAMECAVKCIPLRPQGYEMLLEKSTSCLSQGQTFPIFLISRALILCEPQDFPMIPIWLNWIRKYQFHSDKRISRICCEALQNYSLFIHPKIPVSRKIISKVQVAPLEKPTLDMSSYIAEKALKSNEDVKMDTETLPTATLLPFPVASTPVMESIQPVISTEPIQPMIPEEPMTVVPMEPTQPMIPEEPMTVVPVEPTQLKVTKVEPEPMEVPDRMECESTSDDDFPEIQF